jgi:heptosyltransferase III
MVGSNKILIYRLGSLGDTVVALPCFHLIARAYPDSDRILLTNAPVNATAPAAWSVLGDSGLIHNYISYSLGTRNAIDLAKLCVKIRKLGVKTVVYLTPPRGEQAIKRDEKFFRLCGAKEIVGIPRGELATWHYDPIKDRYESEASRLARCLAPIGDARVHDLASWDPLLTGKEKDRAAGALRALNGTPFLALGIASKQAIPDWGIENWKSLMPQLRRQFPNHAIVFIGAREDCKAANEVAAQWKGTFLNLSGGLTPRESAAVMQKADIFIGIDSGPMHLAASVRIPCVTIFAAHRLPGEWFPPGDGHELIYHKTACFGCELDVCGIEKKRCILSISPEEVVAAAVRAEKRACSMTNR